MDHDGSHLFETRLGWADLAWRGAQISGVRLPSASRVAAERTAARQYGTASRPPDPPPLFVAQAAGAIANLLAGVRTDLSFVELDLTGVPAFDARVYEAARGVAAGSVVTYGALAAQLGERHAAQAVGQALGRNPYAIVVPCHRVIGARGELGGFSAGGGVATKARLLEIERAPVAIPQTLF